MIRLFTHYVSARKLLLALTELLIVYVTFAVGASLRLDPVGLDAQALGHATYSALFAAVLCLGVMGFQDLYDWRVSASPRERHPRIAAAFGITFVVLAAFFAYAQQEWPAFALGPPGEEIRVRMWRLIGSTLIAFTAIALWRSAFHAFFGRWRFAERVLILGAGELAMSLAREIAEHRESGFEIAGMVPGRNERPKRPRRRDPVVRLIDRAIEELFDVARELRVQRVVVALQDRRQSLPVEALLKCRLNGLRIEEREQLYERVSGKIAVEALRPSYLIFSEGFRKPPLTMAAKRALDVLTSLIGLTLSLPITLVTAFLIRLDSRGPLFYRQPRVGKDGRVFEVLKFRSMRVDAEAESGPVWARSGDDRVTRVGRVIRKTRVDEIPQMWNVLRGEMSFVGPRPERPVFVEELAKEIPYYLERLTVKPGLTGWAQVSYPYGSSKADALRKLQYDLFYIKNLSVAFDLAIMFRTIKVVVLRRGAV